MNYTERKEAEAFERGLNIGRLEAAKELAAAEERGRRMGIEELPESVRLIAAERKRQVEQEGWTTDHDDEHTDGALASAAACYAIYGHRKHPPSLWPWDREWWRPGADPIRRLVKAGALIAAEIERLQRETEAKAYLAAIAPRDSEPANRLAYQLTDIPERMPPK